MTQFAGLSEIAQIAVTVKDLPRAIAFYQQTLGLPLLFTAGSMAFFKCSNLRLMLTIPEKPDLASSSSILYYKVPSARQMLETLTQRGVVFESPAHLIAKMPAYDLWMAFFRDSEGNLMALMSEEPQSQ